MPEETREAIARRADSLIADHEQLLAGLVAARKRNRISQATVAQRMGVSQPTVAGFERYDANPTLSTIRRYALAVGVRLDTRVLDDLVGDTLCAEAEAAVLPPVRLAVRDSPFSVAWDNPTTAEVTRA